MSHIKHDSLKATYLSGGRYFWMVWIIEGEKEARYGNKRQDGDGDGEQRTSLEEYKSKTQDGD